MQKELLSKVTAITALIFLLFSCASNPKKALDTSIQIDADEINNINQDIQKQTPEIAESPSITDVNQVRDETESTEEAFANDNADLYEKITPDTLQELSSEELPFQPQNSETDSERNAGFMVPEELIDKTPLPDTVYGEATQNQKFFKTQEKNINNSLPLSEDYTEAAEELSEAELEPSNNNESPDNVQTDNDIKESIGNNDIKEPTDEEDINKTVPQNVNTASGVDSIIDNDNKSEDPKTSPLENESQSVQSVVQTNENSPLHQQTPAEDITFREATEEEINQESLIKPSRSVTVKNNQYLDIVYPGSGWVYLGETDGNKLLSYFGRKLGSQDTSFTLRSRKSGITTVHFYKTDALTGDYIDDYLMVTVTEDTASAGERQTAPSYAQVVPTNPQKRESLSYTKPEVSEEPFKNLNQKKAVEKNEELNEPSLTSEQKYIDIITEKNIQQSDLLEKAKDSYNSNDFEKALGFITEYINTATEKLDQAYFLQGQILEADSPVRNIRKAIESYGYVLKNYPASDLWKASSNRTIYLKRFYIDIR